MVWDTNRPPPPHVLNHNVRHSRVSTRRSKGRVTGSPLPHSSSTRSPRGHDMRRNNLTPIAECGVARCTLCFVLVGEEGCMWVVCGRFSRLQLAPGPKLTTVRRQLSRLGWENGQAICVRKDPSQANHGAARTSVLSLGEHAKHWPSPLPNKPLGTWLGP